MRKIILTSLFILVFTGIMAQKSIKPFKECDSYAYVSYRGYHPFQFIYADNNWEVMQALKEPRTIASLRADGIKVTQSQVMLLNIEGLVANMDNNKFKTVMPIFDSLKTETLRNYSRTVATDLYKDLKPTFKDLASYLLKNKWKDNIYSVVFSYLLDGKVWQKFTSYEGLSKSATWSGMCWTLYTPRPFFCGTNSFGAYSMTWTKRQPQFVFEKAFDTRFIEKFTSEYNQHGKVEDADILKQALPLGLIQKNGTLRIPVIHEKDSTCVLNILSNKIVYQITNYFGKSDVVDHVQQHLNIASYNEARTILYHEVMWDLLEMMEHDKIITKPSLWNEGKMSDIHDIVFLHI